MKLPTFIKNVSKRTYAVLAMAVATVVVPATLLAWGPSTRVTFTEANPASYVTFNSITDNKQYGNETNFVQVRNVTDNTEYSDDTTLTPGKEYEVFAYYHNNASSSLNASGTGIATGAFMRTQMPSTVKAGEEARITSFVGAANAKHLDKDGKNLGNQVWDEAYGKNTTGGDIALSFVSGSAKITSKGAVNGKTLPDALWGNNGTLLGYDALDGKLPGCLEFSGYVTYRFKVNQPNFTVEKSVRKSGEGSYVDKVQAAAGATVDFRIEYKNTGTTPQAVTIRDQLPAGLEYVAGSTYFANSNTGGQWKAAEHDTVTKQGLGIGSYTPGANAYVKFTAKVPAADKLACGVNKFVNTAAADTENGSKSDTATVEVTKECQPPKEIQVCRLSDKKYPVTIKESDFDTSKYSKNPNDCKEVPVEKCPIPGKEHLPKDSPDCKENPPVEEKCPVPGKEHLPADSKDCEEDEAPEVEELPETGMSENILSLLGVGSLAGVTSAYIASRRK